MQPSILIVGVDLHNFCKTLLNNKCGVFHLDMNTMQFLQRSHWQDIKPESVPVIYIIKTARGETAYAVAALSNKKKQNLTFQLL